MGAERPLPGDLAFIGESARGAARQLQGHVLGARVDGAGALWIGLDHDMYCTVHRGPMKLDFALDRYACAGFDGEGCDHHVRIEDTLTFLGTVEPGEFQMGEVRW